MVASALSPKFIFNHIAGSGIAVIGFGPGPSGTDGTGRSGADGSD
jgi:hypothetical protein